MSLNFAHRGWSGLYPENTLLAFQKAIELGVDGFEMDVQLSRDGEVVVFHDETLDRVTGYHGYLRDLTVSELKRLDASSGFRGLYGKNEIPTLREFLELVAPTELIVNMELKNNRQYYPSSRRRPSPSSARSGWRSGSFSPRSTTSPSCVAAVLRRRSTRAFSGRVRSSDRPGSIAATMTCSSSCRTAITSATTSSPTSARTVSASPVDGELTARDPAPCGLGRLLHQHELPEPAQINQF